VSTSWPGDHPGELLTAFLDGELPPEDAAAVDAHLTTCEACRQELESVRTMRDLLRRLAEVDAPFGFYERILKLGPSTKRRRDRRFRFGIANIAATVAAWALILGAGSLDASPGVASPAVADLVSLHVHTKAVEETPPDPEEERSLGVPPSLAGSYELVGVRSGSWPQAIYSDGRRTVSVFVIPGQLDEDVVAGARPAEVNGFPAWQVSTDQADVVLLQRADAVVVIVGSAWPADLVPEVAAGPDPEIDKETSVADRLEQAGRQLLKTFGLEG